MSGDVFLLDKYAFMTIKISTVYVFSWGTRWRSWLRHCATSWHVAGSISDGVTGIFHWHNPSGRTMALGVTQPLTEISTRNFFWGVKAAGVKGWQPYHLHMPIVLKSRRFNPLETSGPVQACNGIFLMYFHIYIYIYMCVCVCVCVCVKVCLFFSGCRTKIQYTFLTNNQ